MLKYIQGDLTEIESGIICQQVNCQGVMGSGLAKAIRDKWPKVFDEYKTFLNTHTYSERFNCLGRVCYYSPSKDFLIASQSKVWLGRIKNNVGAFTENMEEFEQGKKDKAIREAKKTSKYDVGAILIPSNKVYCGKFFKTFDIWAEDLYHYRTKSDISVIVNIHSKPITQYLYQDYDWLNNSISWYNFINSKTAGVLSEETVEVDLPTMWNATKECLARSSYTHFYMYRRILAEYQNVRLDHVNMPDPYEQLRLQYVSEEELDNNYLDQLKEYFDKYKIPYVIDADEEDLKNQGYAKN